MLIADKVSGPTVLVKLAFQKSMLGPGPPSKSGLRGTNQLSSCCPLMIAFICSKQKLPQQIHTNLNLPERKDPDPPSGFASGI